MALSMIPTSFVPRATPVASAPRHIEGGGSGALGAIAYGILGIVFVLALGVFFYNRILIQQKDANDAALAKAESGIDAATVEGFVRLRDRLDSSQSLMKGHTAFSNFFVALEKLLPANVRFTALHLSFDATGAATLQGSGTAKSFNTLAAASSAFATDNRIKDVIFSGITINRDSSVSFTVAANLDPSIVTYTP
jgi:hypothetical protein